MQTMPPRASLTSSFSVTDVNNEVVCPLKNNDGSNCRKRCLGVSTLSALAFSPSQLPSCSFFPPAIDPSPTLMQWSASSLRLCARTSAAQAEEKKNITSCRITLQA